MPNYKGHLLGGVMVYAVLLCCFVRLLHPSFLTACEWLLFTLAGALFPDIDVKSKGQKYFYHLIFLLFMMLAIKQRYTTITCCSFMILIPMLVRHRGIFHSPRFVTALALCLWILTSMLMPAIASRFFISILFFIVGALSHIWLDFGIKQMLTRLLSRSKKYSR